MKLRKSSRQSVKLRVGLSAVSGAGKTLGALRLAYGLVGDWDKIAVIDTESGSGEIYTDQTFTDNDGSIFEIGSFNYIKLTTFSPEKYIEAIVTCEKEGMEAIIIDSFSHSWEFILAAQASMTGNSYVNWGVVKPRQARLKTKILQSPCHIFTTVRRKQDYEMAKDSQGRNTVQKLGMKEIIDEGWEYELTLNLEIEQNHLAKASKDRTNLFAGQDPFRLTEEVGEQLKNWCNSGVSDTEQLLQVAAVDISNASSLGDLNTIYIQFPLLHSSADFMAQLKAKKAEYSAAPVAAN